jgi:hypothetical protein
VERVRIWAEEVFADLLPVQQEPGVPVLLACDDETLRVVAERLGGDVADPSAEVASDVKVAFQVGKIAGWKLVTGGDWEKAPRPGPCPPSSLCSASGSSLLPAWRPTSGTRLTSTTGDSFCEPLASSAVNLCRTSQGRWTSHRSSSPIS